MDNSSIIWKPVSRKTVFKSKPFDIHEISSLSPKNKLSNFYSLHARNWVIVIPVLKEKDKEDSFLLVWQWRHGSSCISLEFPGGVIDEGETAKQAAHRELTEETGYKAKSLSLLGSISPNPAIMGNRCFIFLAENLEQTNKIDLDDDEFVELEIRTINQVCNEMGNSPYDHGLMSTALFLYLQKKGTFK